HVHGYGGRDVNCPWGGSCGPLQPLSMKKTHRTNGSPPLHLPPPKGRPQAELCSTAKPPTPRLRALPPMTAPNATALGPALDEPGALQQPSTVHVSEGSLSSDWHSPDAHGMSALLRSRPNLCSAAK